MKKDFNYHKDAVELPKHDKEFWVVGINKPAYPKVYCYYTEEEALLAFEQITESESMGEDGFEDGVVFISKGIKTRRIKTY